MTLFCRKNTTSIFYHVYYNHSYTYVLLVLLCVSLTVRQGAARKQFLDKEHYCLLLYGMVRDRTVNIDFSMKFLVSIW